MTSGVENNVGKACNMKLILEIQNFKIFDTVENGYKQNCEDVN